MRYDLRVCLGGENVAHRLKRVLQRKIVFDDPVVDKRYPSVRMGMGVYVGGLAVSCPPGMSDSDVSDRNPVAAELFLKIGETPLCLFHADVTVFKNGDPRRVVAAVFEL